MNCQAVTPHVEEEWELEDFNVEPLLRTCSTTNSRLRYVKHLYLVADFYRRLESRYIYYYSRYADLEDLEEELKRLFNRLDDNSLRNFR